MVQRGLHGGRDKHPHPHVGLDQRRHRRPQRSSGWVETGATRTVTCSSAAMRRGLQKWMVVQRPGGWCGTLLSGMQQGIPVDELEESTGMAYAGMGPHSMSGYAGQNTEMGEIHDRGQGGVWTARTQPHITKAQRLAGNRQAVGGHRTPVPVLHRTVQ